MIDLTIKHLSRKVVRVINVCKPIKDQKVYAITCNYVDWSRCAKLTVFVFLGRLV